MKKGIDDGHCICDDCDGEGKVLGLMAGPNGPIEYSKDCDSCDGYGQIEVEQEDPPPVIKSRNQREGKFTGQSARRYPKLRNVLMPDGSLFPHTVYVHHRYRVRKISG